jgi:hypothetical protein
MQHLKKSFVYFFRDAIFLQLLLIVVLVERHLLEGTFARTTFVQNIGNQS